MDLNQVAQMSVPLWNETRWCGCFNPEANIGLFLHVGRLRGNLEWWWAQTVIFLPGGKIAVERSWVRNPADTGVKTASLELRMNARGWSARFDGIVELTSTKGMAVSPRGASAPNVYASFEVTCDGNRPLWDMYAVTAGSQHFAGDMHAEQMGSSIGTLQVGYEQYRLDGVGFADHSCGIRDLTKFHSYDFCNIAMPEDTIHVLSAVGSDRRSRATFGVWMTPDGLQRRLESAELPRPTDLLGSPSEFALVLKADGLLEQSLQARIVHTFAYTITNGNDNINGVDWEASGDPLICVDSLAVMLASDGKVGHAIISRGDRRTAFTTNRRDETKPQGR